MTAITPKWLSAAREQLVEARAKGDAPVSIVVDDVMVECAYDEISGIVLHGWFDNGSGGLDALEVEIAEGVTVPLEDVRIRLP